MSVLHPGFSERVFEFSFNAEYAAKNWSVLAGVPHIPTQNQEKYLGYDVEFELNQLGGAVHSVALQHKVSRYVDGISPANAHFWTETCGPYFAFHLDAFQYNLIESIASSGLNGVEFYYCAPVFVTRKEISSLYMAKAVDTNSIWIDVQATGPITTNALHTMVYSFNAANAFMFSEKPVRLEVISGEARRVRRAQRKEVDFEKAIPQIYEKAFEILQSKWRPGQRTKGIEADNIVWMPKKLPDRDEPTLRNTAQLLSQYFGLSWLIEARK